MMLHILKILQEKAHFPAVCALCQSTFISAISFLNILRVAASFSITMDEGEGEEEQTFPYI